MEKEYREWLDKNLIVKVVTKEKYINAIKTLSFNSNKWGFRSIDLYTKEGIKFIDDIMNHSDFIAKNKRGNNMYSSALKHYINFLSNKGYR